MGKLHVIRKIKYELEIQLKVNNMFLDTILFADEEVRICSAYDNL